MEWVLTNPNRFLHERAEMERLAKDAGWLTFAWRLANSELQVDVDLTVHGRIYAGRLTYPAVFPNSPPYICPRDPSERWSNHQYGAGGALCLQWRADNWQPQVTGAEMVRSAYELLHTEQQPQVPGVVPSDHRVTQGQALRGTTNRLIATAGLLEMLRALPTHGRFRITACNVTHRSVSVRLVAKVGEEGEEVAVPDVPSGLASFFPLFSWSSAGSIFRSATLVNGPDPSTVDELIKQITDDGLEAASLYSKEGLLLSGLVLFSSGDKLKAFAIETGESTALSKHQVIVEPTDQIRLNAESVALKEIKVGIVGLGSIGSKVAASLARSGVNRFILVDDDLLLPGNMIRHELTWASIGVHKARAAHDWLRLIAADVDVSTHSHRLAGQESAISEAALLKQLADCDLLVDASANPEVFLRLAAVATTYKRALVWGEVFAGGYGGLVARARPDLDPSPLNVRAGFYAHLETLPPAPFRQAANYDGSDETPFVAYDSDVAHIASALTRLAIDTALKRTPSQFPYPVYLIGLRREWVFTQPFDTRPVAVQGGGWEMDGQPVSDDQRIEVIKQLINLHAAQTDAHGITAS